MIHGRFSLAPPNRGTGAIPAGLFAGIAPIANVVCARPSTEVECVFVHFPISSNFCEKLLLLQEDRNGLPGCMERIQLLLGVSSQKPKRNWLMIDLSRKNKKTCNDRQLFFTLCSPALYPHFKVQKPLHPPLHPISYISVYVQLHVYICVGVLLKHIVRV